MSWLHIGSCISAPEPLKRRELPSEPWQHIALDFLGPLPTSHNLFVIVDYYSRFLEIEIMKKIDSTEAIKRLRNIFARFGLPLTITADNGRQLISDKFKAFCETDNHNSILATTKWGSGTSKSVNFKTIGYRSSNGKELAGRAK